VKHRISAPPIAGTSAALLLLVLAAFLFLRGTDTVPEKPPRSPVSPVTGIPAGSPSGPDRTVTTDTLPSEARIPAAPVETLRVQPASIPAPDQDRTARPAAAYARTGVSFRWAGGKMRTHLEGELPKVQAVAAKTTLVLEATVSPAGRVTRLNVLGGGRNRQLLDRTVAAVRGWRFERQAPGRKPGAERCRITITYAPPGR
jgi:TonB family protein